jgi:hypothetical protein
MTTEHPKPKTQNPKPNPIPPYGLTRIFEIKVRSLP